MPRDAVSQDLQRILWDVIVVGTGPGGAAAGWALTAPGRRILFVERGPDLRKGDALRGQMAESLRGFRRLPPAASLHHLAQCGRLTESIEDAARGDRFLPQLGCGTGGSSALYGMAFERMFPSDFEGRWPFSYDEIRPWYEVAERLFRVRGTPDPLRGEPVTHLLEPPSLSPSNRAIFDALRTQGLHPYRLHLACERLPGCTMCQGYLCGAETPCKNDASRICLEPALAVEGNALLAGTEVTSVEAEGRSIRIVHARGPDGSGLQFRGRIVILAGGALSTPRILLQSRVGNESGLVGRCLMRHAIELFILRKAPRPESPPDAKELGLNDYYCNDGRRLGSIQSFGLPPTLDYLRNQPGFNIWRCMGPLAGALARRFSGTPIIATIVEDAPDPENGVAIAGGAWRIRYRLGSEDDKRRQALRAQVLRIFGRFGPVRGRGTDDRKGLGHVCGTCRMGGDPHSSVLDRWNRVHDFDNLYVTDASCFPVSAAVNPALTIVSNAFRAAEQMRQQL
jgi:choline dehydrogenase-like flavoprotein